MISEFPPSGDDSSPIGYSAAAEGPYDATITPITGVPAVVYASSDLSRAPDQGQADDGAATDPRTFSPRPGVFPETLPGRGEGEFANLYQQQHERLVRLAFVLTGSREIAEDVVQDSFVRLYKHWRTAEHPDRYVRQIVVNECRSHHRRSGRERDRRALLYVVDSTLDRHGVELADVLLDLPYRQRAAIVLRFYSDLSENEIAHVLGCRPGTVGSLIHRGLERLRKAINE